MRWYLRHGLSYRDVEELLGERRIEVDYVTVYRWVQRLGLLDVNVKLTYTAGYSQHNLYNGRGGLS